MGSGLKISEGHNAALKFDLRNKAIQHRLANFNSNIGFSFFLSREELTVFRSVELPLKNRTTRSPFVFLKIALEKAFLSLCGALSHYNPQTILATEPSRLLHLANLQILHNLS